MIKFSLNTDFNWDIEPVSIITEDKQLTKRASSSELLKFARTPGQTDLHIIAVGAYEGTGFNRNGDMFKEADCEKNHHYFKQADRAIHRHHKNKPTDPKYGNIKASAYNKNMKRIELIVGLDNDKCADILDEQEKKGYTNWSMASKQAYDICTWCQHKAASDKDRCECIPAKIGELNKEGVMCGMENPNPRWFEQSYVHRPADRIGMSLKVASDMKIKPMLPSDFLNIYTGFVPPEDEFLISKKASDKRNLIHKLAEMEKHVDAIARKGPKNNKETYVHRQAHKINKSDKMNPKDMDSLRSHKPDKAMKAMSDKGEILGPDDFMQYLFGGRLDQSHIDGAKTHIPGMYSQMEQDGTGHDAANNEQFDPSASDMLPPELKALVQKLFSSHSLHGGPANQRVMKITIEMGSGDSALKPTPKEEERTKDAADKELAKVYCNYKLAQLNYMNEKGILDDEILLNAVIQNFNY